MEQLLAGRSAVLAPGGSYGADGPLLMYAGFAVQHRGGRTHPIAWQLSGDPDFRQYRRQVASQVELAVDELTAATGAAPVVIGKSLGSLAAPVAADRGLAAVWFTPLLTDEPTVAALRRATGPCLLVGGTADQFWDGQAARSLLARSAPSQAGGPREWTSGDTRIFHWISDMNMLHDREDLFFREDFLYPFDEKLT
jgi:hypothetical protein